MGLTRFLFILLIVLNALAFAAIRGWLGSAPPPGEPERLTNQLHPERIRFAGDASQPDAPPPVEAPATIPTDAPPPVTPTAPTAALQQVCVAWSGLTGDDAGRLVAHLQAAGIVTRHSNTDTPNAWWVRIPPQGGRDQAERKLKELKALGVTDFFVVQDPGPNQFAISLGLFKTETAANQQLAQLRSKGVRSAGVVPRLATQHRVEAEGSSDQLAGLALEARIEAARGACQP